MKIAFDENMPLALVRTFRTLARDKAFRRTFGNLQIVSAIDYTPKTDDDDYLPKNDVPWLTRYKKSRGRIFISGDTKMPDIPHELAAIEELGLIAFFLPPKWNGWKFPRKTALVFAWMERIISQAETAKPGMLFRIPNDWREDAPLYVIPSPGPLKLKLAEFPASEITPRAKRTRRSTDKTNRENAPDLFPESRSQSH